MPGSLLTVVGSNRLPTLSPFQDSVCPIQSLPNELLETIIRHLSLEDLLHCSQVSLRWFSIVSEMLLRTKSCILVNDEASCRGFNSNEKVIRQLILRSVDLWQSISSEKVGPLESFYLDCKRWTDDTARNMRDMLRQSLNLTRLTLHTDSPLSISQLEELLSDLKHIKSVCLVVDEMDEEFKKILMQFFDDCSHFYSEIVIQVLNPSNELTYVCSDSVTPHPHVHSHYSKVIFGKVSPALVQTILSNSDAKVNHVEIDGSEISSDEIFKTIGDRFHLEYLRLHSFSNANQAVGGFFKNLGATLKELQVSDCSNITDEELAQLERLHLNRLDVDLTSCPKASVNERFLNYCLSHVQSLRICCVYNENILSNLLGVFRNYSIKRSAITKQIDIDIIRVNHCSERASDRIQEFKSSLGSLARQCSIHVNVAELFTRVSHNS